MLPLALDLSRLAVALIGEGDATRRRLALLDAAGATRLRVFAPLPCPALRRAAGPRLQAHWPEAADLAGAALVFVADLDLAPAGRIAAFARAQGAIVNVEDRLALCDVHVPALVRRGDLLIAVSTGGRSPGLASRLARHLGRLFGPEWAGHLAGIARARKGWREEEMSIEELMCRTDALIDAKGWLAPAGAEPVPREAGAALLEARV